MGRQTERGHPGSPPFDLAEPNAAALRFMLGHYATGVAVLTGIVDGVPCGMAVNSFTSVSLDPPLVLFCPSLASTTWPLLRRSEVVAVNLLSRQQQALGSVFSGKGRDRFESVLWRRGPAGAPLLDGALAWLECKVAAEHLGGDHTIVVGEVLRLGVHAESGARPLVFFRGDYFDA